jgi:hypothetical protein
MAYQTLAAPEERAKPCHCKAYARTDKKRLNMTFCFMFSKLKLEKQAAIV